MVKSYSNGEVCPITRLWSVLDMIEHHCLNLCTMHSGIRQEMITISALLIAKPEIRSHLLPPGILEEIKLFAAVYAEQECSHLDMPISTQKARSLKASIDSGARYSAEVMLKELEGLAETITMELAKQKFAYIPIPLDQYFEQEKLFGDGVYEKFEAARQDIKDVGNCLAASLPTASVFHSMRVAEIGLRHIARKFGVKLKDKGKPTPVDFATWDKVISGIRGKLNKAHGLPNGPRKNKQLQFYSDLADQCMYFKDMWRNEVAHSRRRFIDAEAEGIMVRVRDFMGLLGTAI
jgi:hypothetical protein